MKREFVKNSNETPYPAVLTRIKINSMNNEKLFWSTANQTRGFGAKISFNEMRKFIKWKEYHIEGYPELARYKSQLFEQGHHIEGYPSFVQQ